MLEDELFAVTVTVFVNVTPVEKAIKITLSEFLVNSRRGTARSAAIAAGTPFGKVAVTEVEVHPVTATSADLNLAFAVKSEFAGKSVPVKERVFPERVTPVTVGEDAAS